MPQIRPTQRIFFIQRKSDGTFLHCSKSKFTDDPAQAFIVSQVKFKGVVRVYLGRDLEDFRMIEAVPALPSTSNEALT